ncbi:FAD-linked oxidoreductase [Lipingzhangella halophila]|uniref:FAD-linked oxidoreductase n=1 Tax=Lipingzhangella halophila TaxID=1783352 RepID=A0A7W7RHW5_9ACTN|nr:D-arabinono-1,4-lactone oxidase [Lipingzhangella halophila]MBB4932210.1 FAD-linked oxidoreductase [Lipingzhangella halophila]
MSNVVWHTWSGTHQARPRRLRFPNSTGDVAAAVRSAAGEGLPVRMVGSGHSFTGVAVTDGMLLAPTALSALRSVDPQAGTATVEAGLPLRDLNEALAGHGVALANMGDIATQTVAGAVQTGTHGTGRDTGGLAAQVCAMELVLADGNVVTCSPTENAGLFDAARVGLGAFGVVTALTVAVRPAFLLHAREEPMPLDEILEGLPQLRSENEHCEFYWFPHTGQTITKRNNLSEGPAAPLPPFSAWLADEFLSNSVFEVVNRFARRAPAAIPAINQLSARSLSARQYVDASYRVFTSPRRVRFVEMEYAIPAEELADVLREIRATIRRRGHRISFPVEVRFAPADDAWLSTAYGRDTAYIAAHVYRGAPYEDYFSDLEAVFTSVRGRPHWGKLHTRDTAYLDRVYPCFSAAMDLRDRVDPERRFGNDYLTDVLGP